MSGFTLCFDLMEMVGKSVQYKRNYNAVVNELNEVIKKKFYNPHEDEYMGEDQWLDIVGECAEYQECYVKAEKYKENESMTIIENLIYIRDNQFTFSQANASGVGKFIYQDWEETQMLQFEGEEIDEERHQAEESFLFSLGWL